MRPGKITNEDRDIKDILENAKTIAIIGLSPESERESNNVARYLKDQGYRIIPVRPDQEEILGQRVYATLDDINEKVDIVDVFRNPEQVLPHAHEAIRLQPKVFWMQLGIENQKAASLLAKAGIDVVMNRCIKIEHDRLCKKNILSTKTS
jgi:predicted CoA-binding protein